MESAERSVEHRHDRLAELVWHLTDCEPTEALAAVDRPADAQIDYEAALALVARGLWRVRRVDLTDRLDLRDRLHLGASEPEATATP